MFDRAEFAEYKQAVTFQGWEKYRYTVQKEQDTQFGAGGFVTYINPNPENAISIAIDYRLGEIRLESKIRKLSVGTLKTLFNTLKNCYKEKPELVYIPEVPNAENYLDKIPMVKSRAYVLCGEPPKLQLFYINKAKMDECQLLEADPFAAKHYVAKLQELYDQLHLPAEEKATDDQLEKHLENIKNLTIHKTGIGWEVFHHDDRIVASDIHMSSCFSADFEKFQFALDVLNELLCFPPELVNDILKEIKNIILAQEIFFDKLISDILADNSEIIKKLQEALGREKESGCAKFVMGRVKHFVRIGKNIDALALCNLFPEKQHYYQDAHRIALQIKMTMKNQTFDNGSNESKDESSLDADEGNKLSYEEGLFKKAWIIAKISQKKEDIVLVLHLLDQISGESGLDRGYFDVTLLNEVDVLIARSRVCKSVYEKLEQASRAIAAREAKIQELEKENAMLRGNIKQPADQARVSELNMFATSDNTVRTGPSIDPNLFSF